MNTLAVVETNVAVLFLVADVQVLLQLVQTVEQLLALLKRAVVACFVLDLFGYLLV